MLSLIADESCDFAVVRALRAAGHEVVAVAEVARGATDNEVIDLARRSRSVLITEDKDFGQLVFAAAKETSGVVLIRYRISARSHLPQAVKDLIASQGNNLVGSFVVMQPSRVRILRPH